MNYGLAADVFRQHYGALNQFSIVCLVNGEIIAVKLHFAHVNYIVVAQNQKVNLSTICLAVAGNSPRRLPSRNSGDLEGAFDLVDMPKAQIFKGIAAPSVDFGRRDIVGPKIWFHILLPFHTTQIKQTEWVYHFCQTERICL